MILKIWLDIAKLPRTSFYEWKEKLHRVDQEEIRLLDVIKEIIEESKQTYGYRRVTIALRKKGILVNHKRVARIMREHDLRCSKFYRRSRRYNSFKGEIGKIADNIVDRNFTVKEANKVWVSDVTEFKIPGSQLKLYLSPIMDLFNAEIVSFHLDTSPTIDFTNKSLKDAVKRLPAKHKLTVHTDQGFHYQHKSWVNILQENNIKQSMSRRGNCLDNAPMENFFGLLKQEIFYGVTFNSIDALAKEIRRYIYWYNNYRIKEKLNGLSPIEYRLKAA